MKKILFTIISLALVIGLHAQVDRTKAPKAGPAPVINVGDAKTFTLDNGLKVFVVENHKLPKVSYNLFLNYSPVLEGANVGYVSLAADLVGTATSKRTKNQIDNEIDFIGARFSTTERGLRASCLKKHNEKLLDILSDVAINAVFTQTEFDKLVNQKLSALASEKDDPQSIANKVSSAVLFGPNHPYGEVTTEASIKSVTLDMCKQFYGTYYRPNIAYLSIVGDITVEEARPLVEKYFANWKKADVPVFEYKIPNLPAGPTLVLVDRPTSVQSVVSVCYALDYKLSSSDYINGRVMNTILGGGVSRLFENLREKHGWTYGAYSDLYPGKFGGGFTAYADVRNSVTDSAIVEILKEMKRLQIERVSQAELIRTLNSLTGAFALDLENAQTIADFAFNTERYNLSKDFYKNYLKTLNAVNDSDIITVARKYLQPNNCYIVVVGKVSEIAEKLKKFSYDGKILYYDTEGKPVDPLASAVEIPSGLTPQNVFDKYIDVTGGQKQYKNIKNLTREIKFNMQGMAFTVTAYYENTGKFSTITKMNETLLEKLVYDGKTVKTKGMQGERTVGPAELEIMQLETVPGIEGNLAAYGFSAKIVGCELIDSVKTCKVELLGPSGKPQYIYYDLKTGLRVRTLFTQDSPQGDVLMTNDINSYQSTGGIKIPSGFVQTMGTLQVKVETSKLESNSSFDKNTFTLE